ncbi:site-specific integrase [Nocardiopsis exhalans]|uniref:Site-specific integrase n=1 Tax=Nocardiopsis exhalans TaxID=163604 RepID=A0ABY5DBM7_9ACTN|nr:site-specific integrase [Nocardiopsis exhalans]USY20435.1 site-specific integrase [Nocardiopsis exhalans]
MCFCQNPTTKRPYRKGECPKSKRPGHAQWYGRYDAPSAGGQRRQPRVGPFRTRAEAEAAVRAEILRTSLGGLPCAYKVTVAEYFQDWLVRNKPRLVKTSFEDYERIINNLLVPVWGDLKLVKLLPPHLQALYRVLGSQNTAANDLVPTVTERLAPTRTNRGARKLKGTWQYPLSAKRICKVHAVISSVLTEACERGLLVNNPATYTGLPPLARKPPLVWTQARVDAWRESGEKPAQVMVWTTEQCVAFLRHLAEVGERYFALYLLAMSRGPRCGELLGLRWPDVDLNAPGSFTIQGTKTERSYRTIHLGQANVVALRQWRHAQQRERERSGLLWTHSGLVFTDRWGKRISRHTLRERFIHLTDEAGLPPIRFHDLRHCAASLTLSAGADMKIISETLGHSSYAFTADFYTNMMPDDDLQAAEAVFALLGHTPA